MGIRQRAIALEPLSGNASPKYLGIRGSGTGPDPVRATPRIPADPVRAAAPDLGASPPS